MKRFVTIFALGTVVLSGLGMWRLAPAPVPLSEKDAAYKAATAYVEKSFAEGLRSMYVTSSTRPFPPIPFDFLPRQPNAVEAIKGDPKAYPEYRKPYFVVKGKLQTLEENRFRRFLLYLGIIHDIPSPQDWHVYLRHEEDGTWHIMGAGFQEANF